MSASFFDQKMEGKTNERNVYFRNYRRTFGNMCLHNRSSE